MDTSRIMDLNTKLNESISYSQIETLARTICSMNNKELVQLIVDITNIGTNSQLKLISKAFKDLL